jgi:tetratricopeptide (TPR) repeat protein
MFRVRASALLPPRPAAARSVLLLAALAAPPLASAQTGRAQITILEHDGTACRQEAARSGRDRARGWYCLRGLVSHPAGVASVTVQGTESALRADSAGAVRFIGLADMSEQGGDIAVVVRAANGELSEGLYRLTPTAPNPAYPDLQPFALTNLRPRVLGPGGANVTPPAGRVAGAAPAAPPGASLTSALAGAAVAGGAAGAVAVDSTGAPVAAAPAVTEDVTRQYITIREPAEWSGVTARGITMPGRRSVRVVGYASHPGGVQSVEIDGRAAAIRPDAGGSYRFIGFVPVDSVARDVEVLVRGRSGNPVIARYPLGSTPAAQSFATREDAWSPASGFGGKRWAVVVGISAYADTALRALEYADDDARAVYDFLRSPRAGDGGFAEENIRLLVNEEATFAGVREALYSFLRQSTEDDQIIIYFAGHGAPDPARPNDLYLLAHDTRAGQIPSTGFPMRELNRAVEELYARHVVLITDACHSGGITGQVVTRGESNNINDVFLQQLNSTTGGLAVFTASGADQVSQENARWGGGHGVFTHFLLEALEGKADTDGDQIVTLWEMMLYTTTQVSRETQNAQIPSIGNVTYDRYLPMSIVFNPEELAAISPTQPQPQPQARVQGAGGPATGRAPALTKEVADSLADAENAVRMFPASAQYRSRLGRALLRAEKKDEALAAFREAVRLDPGSAEFHADLATALRDNGEAGGSLSHFQDAIRLDGQNGRYQHGYGAALLGLDRMDDALNAFRRAVRLDVGNPAYHASLGDALRRAGRTRDAVASLRLSVQLDGESPVYHRELALALAADGQGAEAVVEMQEAMRRDTSNAAYQVDASAMLLSMGDMAGARAALARAVRMDSTNAGYRAALGELLEQLGMEYEAVLELRAAVRLDSANALYRYQHGMLLTRSNQGNEALAELRAAVRLAPEDASYRNSLGQTLRAAGRPAEALTELIEATRLDPSSGRYHYDLAMLYTEAGRHADALASLELVNGLEPNNREYTTALREARRRVQR